jgi:lipid-binding SYLF domain-containing protein
LIHDPETLKSMGGDYGVKLGTQFESTFLNWGRTADATTNLSNKGIGANFAISYSQGLFGGLSVEVSSCCKI